MDMVKIPDRAHSNRIRFPEINSELSFKVLRRVVGMAGVKTLMIFPVTSLYFSLVTRCIWFDKLMLNAHAGRSSLKKCGVVFHRLRGPV